MNSRILTFGLPKNHHQRVQAVSFDGFDELDFLRPDPDPQSFDQVFSLYRDYIIPKYRFVFGTLVFFHLPEKMSVPFAREDGTYGYMYDDLSLCNALFRKHVHLKQDELVFDDSDVETFFETLKEKGCVAIAKGDRKNLFFLPVGNDLGYLSRSGKDMKLKVDSNFFVMDRFDLGSVFDRIGEPFGLCVKDGRIISPPLFGRETMTVRNGTVSIGSVTLSGLEAVIDDVSYRDKVNASFYSRPAYKKTPSGGFDIVVINGRVVASKKGGNCEIPSAGFVIHLENEITIKDPHVSYSGMEDCSFALQVGNSAVRNGRKTEEFVSPFYDFLKFWKVSYPPSMYPLDYEKDRAPRIVLGCDKDQRPLLLWFEGAGKFGHDPETDSCGVSLSEAAEICEGLGMVNGIHLDGGGSAQILIGDERSLKISDRNKDDFGEAERAVPLGLYVR